MKYVALLRGVNVGGAHRVSKTDFKAVLEGLGFCDVLIYINSGNAVFTSVTRPQTHKVQAALEQFFGFSIPTLIVSADQLQAIANAIPSDWTNDPPKPDKSGQKSDVLFLFPEANTPEIITRVGYCPDVETMLYVDGAILANVSRKNQSKYSLARIIGTPLYQQMTVRNITTVKKLAALVTGS